MMKRVLLAGAAALAFATVAGTASAADLGRPVYKAPAYVSPIYTWAGFYIGINGGGAWGNYDYDFQPPNVGHDLSGGLVGGQLGYNWEYGPLVFGLETDLDWAGISGSNACPNPGFSCNAKVDWLGTTRGRLGYSFNGGWLAYVTGGAAYGNVRRESTGPASSLSQDNTHVGWTVGGGLEYGFARNWSVRAEYLYVDLGTDT